MPKIGHSVTRPGRKPGDPSVTIPVAEGLETVPGIPIHEESDEGVKALEEFKTKLSVALNLSDDILKMELEDYIT